MERHNGAIQSRIDELMRRCATGDVEVNADAFLELAEYGVTAQDMVGFLDLLDGTSFGNCVQNSTDGINS